MLKAKAQALRRKIRDVRLLFSAASLIKEIEAQIQVIEKQINQFIEQMDMTPTLTQIKADCNKIGDAVEPLFSQVYDIKIKLYRAVSQVQAQVIDPLDESGKPLLDEKAQLVLSPMTQTFQNKALKNILDDITKVLDDPQLKVALKQAKEGIEQFKQTIEKASFKPVFNAIIKQTTEIQSHLKSIDVARMSLPQKTALKVGAKMIEQVKVDEIIKPELIAAFEQIREPIQEMIRLLEEKVGNIDKRIDEFEPRRLVTETIMKSEPYQQILNRLGEFMPSTWLSPLKEANATLITLVQQLEPQRICDKVQTRYQSLYDLVEALSPNTLKLGC